MFDEPLLVLEAAAGGPEGVMAAITAAIAMALLLVEVCGGGLVQVNAPLEVVRGRSAPLTDRQLQVWAEAGLGCKVEVVTNEPITQRVGRLTPQVRPRLLQRSADAEASVMGGLSAGV